MVNHGSPCEPMLCWFHPWTDRSAIVFADNRGPSSDLRASCARFLDEALPARPFLSCSDACFGIVNHSHRCDESVSSFGFIRRPGHDRSWHLPLLTGRCIQHCGNIRGETTKECVWTITQQLASRRASPGQRWQKPKPESIVGVS